MTPLDGIISKFEYFSEAKDLEDIVDQTQTGTGTQKKFSGDVTDSFLLCMRTFVSLP